MPVPKLPTVQLSKVTFPKRWRPGPFDGQLGDIDRSQLDAALKAIYDHSYGLEESSLQVVDTQSNSRMATGAVIVPTGGVLKAVATGLSTVSNVVVSEDSGSTPSARKVTATLSTTKPGAIDIYVWQPTSSSVTTPVAATVPVTVRWHAWGT